MEQGDPVGQDRADGRLICAGWIVYACQYADADLGARPACRNDAFAARSADWRGSHARYAFAAFCARHAFIGNALLLVRLKVRPKSELPQNSMPRLLGNLWPRFAAVRLRTLRFVLARIYPEAPALVLEHGSGPLKR